MKTRAALLAVLLLSLLSAGTAAVKGQEPAMLGATLTPTTLTMEQRTATARIQNLGNIPVTVSADARLSTLAAMGYRLTVEPSTLAPEQWATVTMTRQKTTPPSDVTLSILMGPQTRAGMDSTALRFPVPVTSSDKTSRSTLAALVTAWSWTPNGPR